MARYIIDTDSGTVSPLRTLGDWLVWIIIWGAIAVLVVRGLLIMAAIVFAVWVAFKVLLFLLNWWNSSEQVEEAKLLTHSEQSDER